MSESEKSPESWSGIGHYLAVVWKLISTVITTPR